MARIIPPYRYAKQVHRMMNSIHSVRFAWSASDTRYSITSVIVYGTLKEQRRKAIRHGKLIHWHLFNTLIKVHKKMWHRTVYNEEKERLVIVPHGQGVVHNVGLFCTKM